MVAVAGILVSVAVIMAIEVPPLLKKKLKKELWIFSIFLLFGTVLSIAQSMNIKISNPLGWIKAIFKPISNMVEKLLT